MKPSLPKLFVFLTVSALLFSCSSSRFTSKRYGNRDWIKVDPQAYEQPAGELNADDLKEEANRKAEIPAVQEIKPELTRSEIITKNELPSLAEVKREKDNSLSNQDEKETKKINRKNVTEGRLSIISPSANPLVKKISKVLDPVTSDNTSADTDTILIVILAILLPPLGVYLFDGASTMFWITLILCLLGGPLWFFGRYFVSLWGIAIILAVLYVLEII